MLNYQRVKGHKVRRPTSVSCGSCLFVVVLYVLSLSRLSPWRRFLLRLTWTHPIRLFNVISMSFPWLFPPFCCVFHRLAPSFLISNTWSTGFCPEHLLHAQPLYMAFSKPLVWLHTCFGLNLNRGLNKSHVFASKPWFTQSAVWHNSVIHKHHILH